MENKRTILVIDDDKNIRSSIRRMVQENLSSVKIDEAGGFKGAFEVIKNNTPDLIILDVMMPEMNGLQILNYLKKSENPAIKNIPVVMLTAFRNKEISEKAKRMGAVDFITKPLNEKIFLLKLKKYIKYAKKT